MSISFNKEFFTRSSTWVNIGGIATVIMSNLQFFDLSPDVRGYISLACGVAVTLSQTYSAKKG